MAHLTRSRDRNVKMYEHANERQFNRRAIGEPAKLCIFRVLKLADVVDCATNNLVRRLQSQIDEHLYRVYKYPIFLYV